MAAVMGAAVGGAVGGLASAASAARWVARWLGALAGNLVGRALDNQERHAFAQATQNAFVAETNVPTTYTVEKTSNQSASTPARLWSPPSPSAPRPAVPTAAPAGRSS